MIILTRNGEFVREYENEDDAWAFIMQLELRYDPRAQEYDVKEVDDDAVL